MDSKTSELPLHKQLGLQRFHATVDRIEDVATLRELVKDLQTQHYIKDMLFAQLMTDFPKSNS